MKRILLLLLATASLHAQVREELTVEVVDVPVHVIRAGEPVEGLTRDDFELFVNGKKQAIEYFDVVDVGRASARLEERNDGLKPVLHQRRLFLFVFDLVFSRPAALKRAQKAAAKLVVSSAPADAYAVATHTSNGGLQFALPFTADRAAVLRAVATLRPTTADDPLRVRITESEREAVTAFASAGSDDSGDALIEDPWTGGGEAMNDARKQPIRRLVEQQVAELGAVAERIAQLDGFKHIVVFSEGFNPYIVHDVRRDLGPRPPQANSALIDAIQRMYNRLQASNTFLHTLDINGIRHTFDPLVNEALNMLSVGTGGRFLHNTNDLGGALTKLSNTHGHMYLLGFRPRGAREGHNRIEVKVKGQPRGTEVAHRRGFSGTPPPQTMDGLKLADIVMNDIPQTGPAARIEASSAGLTLVVPAHAEPADVMLYVFRESGEAVESRLLRLPPSNAERRIDVPMTLPPGRYIAKVLLRGTALGYSKAFVEVR